MHSAGVTPAGPGHQAMPLAAGDEGVSIKISANLMTLQKACLDDVPFRSVSLAGRVTDLSGAGQARFRALLTPQAVA